MDIWHKTPHPTAAWCLSWSDCFLRKCWHHRLEIKPHKSLSALQLTERYCCFINMSSHHPSVYLLSAALLISSKKQLFWCVCVCLRVCVFVLSERWGGNIQCVWCVGVGGKGGGPEVLPQDNLSIRLFITYILVNFYAPFCTLSALSVYGRNVRKSLGHSVSFSNSYHRLFSWKTSQHTYRHMLSSSTLFARLQMWQRAQGVDSFVGY